jgi:outer membrane receptor protein involved in Fe transport
MHLQFNKTRLICTVLLTLLVAVRTSPAQTSPATRPTTTPAASKPSTRPTTRPHPVSNDADLTNLSLEDLMNVPVISVSKTKQRLGDSAAAVTVITQEDIQRSGLRDIPEILRLSPGLFVQRGNQFTGWSISARGFGALFSDKLLVMVDGRTVYTPLFSGVYWNTVDYPIDDLDRIEVIRGPGATLYGANAMNGVINITTKSADETQGLMVDSRAGTDESDASVRYGGQIDDDTYYRVYAKGRVTTIYTNPPLPSATTTNGRTQAPVSVSTETPPIRISSPSKAICSTKARPINWSPGTSSPTICTIIAAAKTSSLDGPTSFPTPRITPFRLTSTVSTSATPTPPSGEIPSTSIFRIALN